MQTPTSDERTLAMFCHLSTFAVHVFPLGNIVAPLILWLVKKDTSPFLDYHGKQVLNFQISLIIWAIVSFILAFVIIGIFFLIALYIMDLVCTIIGAIKAQNGEYYVYPLTFQFIN